VLIPDASDPIALFQEWLEEACEAGLHLAESMALATADPDGQPSVRMVLLKKCDESGFVFYTNIKSRKSADLASNPKAALCFHWRDLAKQVRVEGTVASVSDEEADAYFATRPRESQLGAWASTQSAPLGSREELVQRFAALSQEYEERNVPRPPFWSGFRLRPSEIEFWQEMPHRLHDRVLYVKNEEGTWTARRLFP
jgi:pyridoxamine 5'-phosphate oxidase